MDNTYIVMKDTVIVSNRAEPFTTARISAEQRIGIHRRILTPTVLGQCDACRVLRYQRQNGHLCLQKESMGQPRLV